MCIRDRFSGTIDSNLKFGGDHITDTDVREAAEIAQATEFIDAKPDGYSSPIAPVSYTHLAATAGAARRICSAKQSWSS